MHEFRVRGYAATTVADICRAAGVTKGSFFHHFAGKEALALEGADHFAAMAAGLFASAPYHAHADPLRRVLEYVDFRAEILRGDVPEFTCYLGTLVQETYISHPALREVCKKHIDEHAAELAKDIALAKSGRAAAGGAAGGVVDGAVGGGGDGAGVGGAKDWTPASLALFTQAVLQGAFILAKAHGGPEVAAECVGHLRRYIELLHASPVGGEPERTCAQET